MISDDNGEWLTYAQAGKRLGISPAAVRQLARRRAWQRRTPNAYGARATVLVPDDAGVQPRAASDPVQTPSMIHGANGHEHPHIRALVQALTALQQQLAIANERTQRAEGQVEVLWTALADAQGAERIAAAEAAGLRTEAERRHQWRVLRRLAWLLRGR